MFGIEEWPLSWLIAGVIILTLVIGSVGTRITRMADRLADQTGLGEALFGGIFLGATTSLSGLVTSTTAAMNGLPDLAVSNAIGGIAAQTVFLVAADFAYKRANLEHAVASPTILVQSTLLLFLLALPLTAALLPEVSLFEIHPVTPLILFVYLWGTGMANSVRENPPWVPRETRETDRDEPDKADSRAGLSFRLAGSFALMAVLLGTSGWGMAMLAGEIADDTGLDQAILGVMLTSVITSLPELITTVAAVRQGAATLAVGGIVGGNTFDALFLVASDVGYRDGSIVHAVDQSTLFLFAWSILMTIVLLLGLIKRQESGPAGLGWETVALGVIYVSGVIVQFY